MPSVDQILRENLTDEQFLAATDLADEVLALACAGSGKSRTLAFRIAKLIAEGAAPESIVAFTFTEKAAESMKRAVSKALATVGLDPLVIGVIYIGTIHSYCQTLLGDIDGKYRQYEVLDENRLVLYLVSRYSTLNLHVLRRSRASDPGYFKTIREVSNAWKIMHDEVVSIQDVKSHDEQLGMVFEALEEGLARDQFIDFSLMIRLVVEALENGRLDERPAVTRIRHLMVDEYQDVNPLQERLIRALHNRSETLFVVGDDDQAIYSWRGADVNNIISFGERYSNSSTHTLSTNFRSTHEIVSSANALITSQLGPRRIDKNPSAFQSPLLKDFRNLWFDTREDEADWVARMIAYLLGSKYVESDGTVRGLTSADFAILMRSTRSTERNGDPRHAAFTEALSRIGILFSLEAGGGVFDRPHVAALKDTFELLREWPVSRKEAQELFEHTIVHTYNHADFDKFTQVLNRWGNLIHAPGGGSRRRVLPQNLLYDLLNAWGIDQSDFDSVTMQEIAVFSRILQDVETVYVSMDSADRFGQMLNFLGNVAESGYDVSSDHVLLRPDAVTVSTVHKVKGLEYPVVFIVDTEQGRFPGCLRPDYLSALSAS
jgi:DNA helicase II / ATP-dependent DNA helicase PcrA